MNNKKIKYITLLFVAAGLLIGSNHINSKMEEEKGSVTIEQNLLDFFNASHTEEIILAAQADLNMDGKEDAVIIYKETESSNKMRAVITDGSGYHLTEPVPAPMENQEIKFKDIDEKDEMEFIVSGEKNGNVGFAIFRIEGLKVVDLFGEGMESCC